MYKSIDKWLPGVLFNKSTDCFVGKKNVFLSICDHFEPFHQTYNDRTLAIQKMQRWISEFPVVQGSSFDAIGRCPRHTFFYPIEQYDRDMVGMLEQLCRNGAGEVEIHLHHRDDTYQSLVEKLHLGKENFAHHGLLPVDRNSERRYGFIHGNWAITNSHPEKKYCGVENEISALIETGCYADFTMPSAPDSCQSRIVNSLYFADDVVPSRSHDFGAHAEVGFHVNHNQLLFVQGPMGLNWRHRKLGILPRIENADLTLANPPTLDRFKLWMNSNIHVFGKPEWIFIKLHTHGCNPNNIEMHLGGLLKNFYSDLTTYCSEHPEIDLHFVTAREMVNLMHAAIDGIDGSPVECLDYMYRSEIS